MKQQILDIIESHPDMRVDKDNLIDIGQNEIASQIEQLMCYREARAICMPLGLMRCLISTEYCDFIYDQLSPSYNRDIIQKAIEQVKNELK